MLANWWFMNDLDKAVSDFKNIFSLQDGMELLNLIDVAYKGKLMFLQMLACNGNKLYAGELAKKMNVSTARVAVATKSLQEKGFVERSQSIDDARKVLITITSKGEKFLHMHIDKLDEILKEHFAKLNAEELSTFISLGEKLFS